MIDKFIPTDFFSRSQSIPTSYTGGISLLEEVGKLETYVNGLWGEYVKNNNNLNELSSKYQELIIAINNYKTQLDNFINGVTIADGSVTLAKLASNIMDIFKNWIDEYIYDMHAFVSFGLEGDYFCVYIPNTWKDINFSTDVDGHLVLEFD